MTIDLDTHLVSDHVPSLDPENTLVLNKPGSGWHVADDLHAELEEGGGEVRLQVELVQSDRLGDQLPPVVVCLTLGGKTFFSSALDFERESTWRKGKCENCISSGSVRK